MMVGAFLASLERADGRVGFAQSPVETMSSRPISMARPTSQRAAMDDLIASGLPDNSAPAPLESQHLSSNCPAPKYHERKWHYKPGTSVRVFEAETAQVPDSLDAAAEGKQPGCEGSEPIYSPDILEKCNRFASAARKAGIPSEEQRHASRAPSRPPVYGVAPADPSQYGAPLVASPGLGWNAPRFQQHIQTGISLIIMSRMICSIQEAWCNHHHFM